MKSHILMLLSLLSLSVLAVGSVQQKASINEKQGLKGVSEDARVFLGECIEVADRLNPNLADRLRVASKSQPDKLVNELRNRGDRFLQLVRLKRKDRKLYDLRVQYLVYDQMIRDQANSARDLGIASKDYGKDHVEYKTLWELVMAREAQDLAIDSKLKDDMANRLKRLELKIAEKAASLEKRVEKITATLISSSDTPEEVLRSFRKDQKSRGARRPLSPKD